MTSIRYPAHWTCQKLKHVASLRSGESITSNDISDSGEYPVYGGNGVRGYTSSHTHEGEYPLIGRQGALCGNIIYASGKFWASEHVTAYGKNFYVQHGEVTFTGEPRLNPLLDVTALYDHPVVPVTLVATGRFERPQLSFQAGGLTQEEVFAFLVLGAKGDLVKKLDQVPGPAGDIQDGRDKVKRFSLDADVLGGATIVAGGITTYLALRPTDKRKSAPGQARPH